LNCRRIIVQTDASQYAYRLERPLKLSVGSASALSAMIEIDNDNRTLTNFVRITDQLMENFGGITNMQLAPDGIVSLINPLKGNEVGIYIIYIRRSFVVVIFAINKIRETSVISIATLIFCRQPLAIIYLLILLEENKLMKR
jgi:sensor domain CHASE-containing protein